MGLEKYENVLHRCFKCGQCRTSAVVADYNCPAYTRFGLETYSPTGFMWLIRGLTQGEIQYDKSIGDRLFSCTMCKSCSYLCPFDFSDILPEIIRTARGEVLEKPFLNSHIKDYLTNVYLHGNPWKSKKEKRGDFFIENGIREYTKGDDYLLYIGDEGSYDFRAREYALAVCQTLMQANVSFGILGKNEISDGNEALRLGEDALFEHIAEQNTALFKAYGVTKIITLSPHAYHVMKNDYPDLGHDISVEHYSTFIATLLKTEKLPAPAKSNLKITFHDPCFLGRWNGVYDVPRDILRSLVSREILEMDRSRQDSFCCGGGLNYFTDILGGEENSPATKRVREAFETGAEVIAVTCPICLVMLEDAIKSQGLDDKIEVKGICELLLETLQFTDTGEI